VSLKGIREGAGSSRHGLRNTAPETFMETAFIPSGYPTILWMTYWKYKGITKTLEESP